ncbi:hypothetical protein QOT17_000808 [Balamuthia mandrillaris]
MPHSDLAGSHGAMAPMEQGQRAGGGGPSSADVTLAHLFAKLDELEKRIDNRMRGLLEELKDNLDSISIPQRLDRFHDDQITLENAKM